MYVYLVEHVREKEDGETDAKTIGIFSSEIAARDAVAETVKLVGFRDHPDGFTIDKYLIDDRRWDEGFHTSFSN